MAQYRIVPERSQVRIEATSTLHSTTITGRRAGCRCPSPA